MKSARMRAQSSRDEEIRDGVGSKPRLLYILSHSYSGSTLLTLLLASHPRISTVGELKASAIPDISTYKCSCGKLISDCAFWKQVTAKMNEKGILFSLDKFGTNFASQQSLCNRILRMGAKPKWIEVLREIFLKLYRPCFHQYSRILEQNKNLMEIICELQGGDIFLDGSKDPNRLMYFIRSGYWDIKLIYLLRGLYGSVYSYMRHHGVSAEVAAREWTRTHKECKRILRLLNEADYIKVYYEELCSKPSEILGRIFGFIGVESLPQDFQHGSVQHHILGNTMRLNSDREIRVDEKWRLGLSKKDMKICEKIAGEMARSLLVK